MARPALARRAGALAVASTISRVGSLVLVVAAGRYLGADDAQALIIALTAGIALTTVLDPQAYQLLLVRPGLARTSWARIDRLQLAAAGLSGLLAAGFVLAFVGGSWALLALQAGVVAEAYWRFRRVRHQLVDDYARVALVDVALGAGRGLAAIVLVATGQLDATVVVYLLSTLAVGLLLVHDPLERSPVAGSTDADADAAAGASALRRQLRDAVADLPEPHRLVVIGTFLEGRSIDDLGGLLRLPRSEVADIQREAVEHLRSTTRADRTDRLPDEPWAALRAALPYGLATTASALYSQAPALIVTALAGVGVGAPLAVVSRVVQPSELAAQAVSVTGLHQLGRSDLADDERLALEAKMRRVALALSLVVVAGLALTWPVLGTVMSSVPLPWAAFALAAPSVIVKFQNYQWVSFSLSRGLAGRRLRASVAAAAICVVLVALTCQRFGLEGALASVLVAEIALHLGLRRAVAEPNDPAPSGRRTAVEGQALA